MENAIIKLIILCKKTEKPFEPFEDAKILDLWQKNGFNYYEVICPFCQAKYILDIPIED